MKLKEKTRPAGAGKVTASSRPREAVPTSLPARDWLWGLVLFVAVLLVYQPVWHAGFLWDDDNHLTANPVIVGPLGLKEIWTTQAAMICPLVLTTFWVEHALWGLAPLPYHLVNVVLHGACAVALWRVLRSLQIPGAWLGAALWALHPVQVESAAYVTELKNTQSGLLYLLTILFFVKSLRAQAASDKSADARYYALTLLFAALAIASKFSTVVLPAVLGLCAWWVEGRWHWRHLLRFVPILVISAIAVAVMFAPHAPDPTKIDNAIGARTWPERLVTAGDVGWFYLGKLLWPQPLMFVYPLWNVHAWTWLSLLPLVAMTGLLLVLWWKRASPIYRACFFALAYFLAAVSPFLGLVDEDFWTYSYVEDHLQYLASMGPLALVGAAIWRLGTIAPAQRWLTPAVGAAVLAICGVLSWQRTWVFQGDEALWGDTVAKNPDCAVARTNLGVIYLDRQEFDRAAAQFVQVLHDHPRHATATMDLGMVYLQTGRVDQAITQFQDTLNLAPTYPLTVYNLGVALLQKGQLDAAQAQFEKALAIKPDYAAATEDLGAVYLKKGDGARAVAQFQRTLAIDPTFPSAAFNLSLAYYQLGTACAQQGQLDAAVQDYERAVQLRPDYADAHFNLGVAFLQKGDGPSASAQFREVLSLNPQDKDAAANLMKAQALVR